MGYKIQQEFKIDFADGTNADCIALEPPEKLGSYAWSKLVQVESGKELSGTTYHKAESAMEAVVRKLGWKPFQNGVQRMIHGLSVGEYIDDKSISSFFKLKKKKV